MAFELPFSYRVTNPVAVDDFYAEKKAIGQPEQGWPSVAAATAGVPAGIRYYGLTVGVWTPDGIVEYWWLLSLADAGLVKKTTAANAPINVVNVLGSSTADAASQKLLTDELAKKAALNHTHVAADITNFTGAADARIAAAAGNTIAPLVSGKVPASFLPAYVSAIVEGANLAAFPNPGAASTIYVALDTNISYRWSGTQYTVIGDGVGVVSFNGRQGNVTLTQADVDAFLTQVNARLTQTETDVTQLENDILSVDNRVNVVEGVIPTNASPTNQLITQADLPAPTTGESGPFTVEGITEFRDRFAASETGTAKEFFTKLLVLYQQVKFDLFTFQYYGSRIKENGFTYLGGQRAFTWHLTNPENVEPNSISVRETVENITYATNLANDGEEIITVPAFNIRQGLTKHFVISALDTKGNTITSEVTLTGAAGIFYGAIRTVPTTSNNSGGVTGVRGLDGHPLTTDGNVFILNTGSVYKNFCIWVPAGKTLLQVLDLDSSNANVTSAYQPTGITTIEDWGGFPASGVFYANRQAIPYTSNHRHEITLG